jgi:hypothetical protein
MVLGSVELVAGGALFLVVVVTLAAGGVVCTTLGVVFCSAGLTVDDEFTPDTDGFFFAARGPRKMWYTPAPISIISTGNSNSPIYLQNGGVRATSGTTVVSLITGIWAKRSAKSVVARSEVAMEADF